MKTIYTSLLVFSIFIISGLHAATITATVNNGDWTSNSTWNPNTRTPQSGDTIIIPTGFTVNVNTNVSVSGYVYIHVYGTLKFNHSSKLDLGSTSIILVDAGGKVISSGSSASDQIRIGGTIVYKGNSGDLNGPILIDNSGTHLASAAIPISLPVRFVSFTLAHQQKDILVQWSTAQEINSSQFVIEKSDNGLNWKAIGTAKAAGESTSLINYVYTDKNAIGTVLYYRIKQVDIDGAYIYTSVAMIKSDDNSAEIKITAASKNTVLINFSQQVRSDLSIRLISASGQVVAAKNLSNPSGQVVFTTNSNSTGVYIVNITDGHAFSISKQVLL